MEKLQGKTALITGGNKGIGLGVAEAMLQQGMKVAITGRDTEDLADAKAKLEKIGEVKTFQVDVTDLAGQETVVNEIVSDWGSLDVVIANAGVGYFAPIDELSAEQWNATIDTNLTGVFNTVKASLEPIKKAQGYIITIASLAGTNFFASGAAYNASKFGLVGFTQAIMLDLRQYGVKVTTIMPGSVSTYFNNHTPSEADAWKIQPEDIGQMVMDLLHMHPRTLPSKVEVRPTTPPSK
ncbi:SDR family oxidoreductase [Algivirga pacifica]|uniref:SDR family oxidoreductase n=1 Tax=Algivirga pacifica TaxID=1162670 RepID=A0ABP9D2U0_9BACT